jgi:hypothetical protein
MPWLIKKKIPEAVPATKVVELKPAMPKARIMYAIYAERNLAAITENDGRNVPATSAGNVCVSYDNHGTIG